MQSTVLSQLLKDKGGLAWSTFATEAQGPQSSGSQAKEG